MAKNQKALSNPLLKFPEFTAQEMKGSSLMVLLKSSTKTLTNEACACTRVYTDADTVKHYQDCISTYTHAIQPELMTVAILQSSTLCRHYGCIRTIQIDSTLYTLREITRNTYQHRGHRIVGCTCVVIGTRDAV